jgi:ribosomal protein S18 acetylase RimI-like enzyme
VTQNGILPATGALAFEVKDSVSVCRADYHNPAHAAALISLLDAYAQDPMGGGQALSEFAKANLVQALAARPQAYSVLAFHGDQPVGLVNCIEGFSTFACRPLVNVHDVAVLAGYRGQYGHIKRDGFGQRIAEKMLALAETIALERGACKLTLEVLSGNAGAIRVYERFGFAAYQLGSTIGQANFLQKRLP